MAPAALSVLHPTSTLQALQMMQTEDDARFVAGGTALQLEWARGLPKPRTMVNIGRLADLAGVSTVGDVIRIGAATPVAMLCANAVITERVPMLAMAAGTVAAPSVRNLGTIGGNVAGRTGCLLPALLVLDAFLEVSRADGRAHESLLSWLSKPARHDEIIEAIYVSAMKGACRWVQRKIGLRAAFTPSVIGVAGFVMLDGDKVISARLAIGGGIVAPARLSKAEADLVGKSFASTDWDRFKVQLAGEIIAPDDAFRLRSLPADGCRQRAGLGTGASG